jgi:glycerophosphoryl diester phosphodiesterase
VATNPQVIAHRGASAVEKENTTVAFHRAATMGSNAAELDIRLCASGEIVVHHNAVIDDGRAINTLNKEQLPNHIPTLAAALDACENMWVNIEIKNDPSESDFDPADALANTMVQLLRTLGPPEQWLISSFRRETIDAVQLLWPQLQTAWLAVQIEDAQANEVARSLVASGHVALHPYVHTLNQHIVDTMHNHGLSVNTWTVDDPERMAQLLDWGVDGLCTNKPDLALELIAARAR